MPARPTSSPGAKPPDYDPVQAFLDKVQDKKPDRAHPGAYYARCPSCGKKGKLHIQKGAQGEVLYCCNTTQCSQDDVREALGLSKSDLFPYDPTRQHRPANPAPAKRTPGPPPVPKHATNGDAGNGARKLDHATIEAQAKAFAANLTPSLLRELLTDLGVTEASLRDLPGPIGYSPEPPHRGYRGGCWTFPEVDSRGDYCGITCRYRKGSAPLGDDGKPKTDKPRLADSRMGIYPARGWDAGGEDEPLFLPEGASCTAALRTVGLAAVGRPSNYGGAQDLADLLREVPKTRRIIVSGENDPRGRRPNDAELWPGRDGALATARKLADALGRPVEWTLPPEGFKDCRDWLKGQEIDVNVADEAHAAGERLRELLLAEVRTEEPGNAPVEAGNEWDGPDDETFDEFPRAVPINDLVDDEEDDWLCTGVAKPGAITLFNATWKIGKTSWLMPLFAAMERSEKFIGLETRPARVLLVTEEASKQQWCRRRDTYKVGNIRLLMRPIPRPHETARWGKFLRYLRAEALRLGCELVVIDTLSAFWPVAEENSAAEVQTALSGIQHILIPARLAVILVHHDRKAGGEPGMGSRGSGALPAAVDIILELKRESQDLDDPHRRLLGLGRFEETPRDLLIKWTGAGYELLAATRAQAAEMRQIDAARELARRLPPFGDPGWTVEEAAEVLGEKPKTLEKKLPDLVERKFARRDKRKGKGGPYEYNQSEEFTRAYGLVAGGAEAEANFLPRPTVGGGGEVGPDEGNELPPHPPS